MNLPQKSSPGMQLQASRLGRAAGYTLVEIMLVLAIISVLLGAGIYYMVGNVDIVQADLEMLKTQLKTYEMENLFMPTTQQGLQALVQAPTSDPKPRRWRPLLEKLPEDPWGMPYNYRNPGVKNPNGFDIYSFGPSRKENDAMLGNWNNK
jgi:general secretion pathway protein G